MNNNQEQHVYTYRRVKLSNLYEEIGKFLKEHGDAEICSISSCNGYEDKTRYKLEIADLNFFSNKPIDDIKEIKIKYEEVPYTKEEWQNGMIASKAEIIGDKKC